MVEVTSVGPLSLETRDNLREYKESRGLNYDDAIQSLLEEVTLEE